MPLFVRYVVKILGRSLDYAQKFCLVPPQKWPLIILITNYRNKLLNPVGQPFLKRFKIIRGHPVPYGELLVDMVNTQGF